jgi:hypothetical protein
MNTKFYSEYLKGNDHLGDQSVEEKIIHVLKWILKKPVMYWISVAQDKIHGKEHSVSTKGKGFPD